MKVPGAVLLGIALIGIVVFVGLALKGPLGSLATVGLALFTFVCGVAGSALLGQGFREEQANRRVKEKARAGLRQLQSHFDGLRAILGYTQELKEKLQVSASRAADRKLTVGPVEDSFRTVEMLVQQQFSAIELSIENWQDLLPDESAVLDNEVAAAKAEQAQPQTLTSDEVETAGKRARRVQSQ